MLYEGKEFFNKLNEMRGIEGNNSTSINTAPPDSNIDTSEPAPADHDTSLNMSGLSKTFAAAALSDKSTAQDTETTSVQSDNLSTEDTLPGERWMPLAIRSLAPLPQQTLSNQPLPLNNLDSFSKTFLTTTLGGEEWSPGLYFSPTHRHLPSGTYLLLDRALEPYLPLKPGQHGAKLSLFFREFDDDDDDEDESDRQKDIQLFIRDAEGEKYKYYGRYSQTRWSDKLDYDHTSEKVPFATKSFWAHLLSAPDRPSWLSDALVAHFLPQPLYTGTIPAAASAFAAADVEDFLASLRDWASESATFLSGVTHSRIMDAFARAGADEPPGLRFWWEYLECTGFDRNFYMTLSSMARGK